MARGTGNKRGPRQPFQPQSRPPPPQQAGQYQQSIMIPHMQQQQQQPQNIIQQQQQYHQVPSQAGVMARSPQQIMIQQITPRMQQPPSAQQQPQQQTPQPQQPQQQYYRMPSQQGIPTSPSQPIILQQGQMPMRVQHQQYQQISTLPPSPSQPIIPQQVQIPNRLAHHSGVQAVRKQLAPGNSWNRSPSPQQQQLQQRQQQQQQQQQLLQHQSLQQPQMGIRMGAKKQALEPDTFILTEQSLREPLVSVLERNMSKHFFSHTLHRTFGSAVAQIIQ